MDSQFDIRNFNFAFYIGGKKFPYYVDTCTHMKLQVSCKTVKDRNTIEMSNY